MPNIILAPSGLEILVDDTDYENLCCYKWHIKKCGHKWMYAFRLSKKSDGFYDWPKRHLISMHRQILGLINTSKEIYVDHIDGNGLNNRRDNLRICNNSDNQKNSSAKSMRASVFKGVSLTSSGKLYRARILVNGVELFLGNYKTEKDAAMAYNNAARQYYGKFAKLNIL